ncbi:hypothetical protein GGS23DRAFT_183091 [Durotheca rogersii]|uniref:uncharacterized protein n=1 Tax=Durotheca rogersii TaxID=419775 RepID=UPI00221FCC6C|nr:uncharacterized protein GGS23DRAFT_183091 [Durotheca rogersii]KAI5867574.1 hypothetical protein GGS23DRAFT_183091 [Durotheca rogersii]
MSDFSVSLAEFEVLIGIEITLVTTTAFLVSIRCFVDFKQQQRLGIDDYTSILGALFLTTTSALNGVEFRALSNPSYSVDQHFQSGVIIEVFTQLTTWSIKASIFFLYLRLFGVHRWMRHSSYAMLVITALVYFGSLAFTLVGCPLDDVAAEASLVPCARAVVMTNAVSGIVSVTTDIIILSLPLPIIFRLQLPRPKKIGLYVVFFSGLLGIAASTVSLYYKAGTTNVVAADIMFDVENSVGLAVGSAPMLWAFWVKYVPRFLELSKDSCVRIRPLAKCPISSWVRRYRQRDSARQTDNSAAHAGSYEMLGIGDLNIEVPREVWQPGATTPRGRQDDIIEDPSV